MHSFWIRNLRYSIQRAKHSSIHLRVLLLHSFQFIAKSINGLSQAQHFLLRTLEFETDRCRPAIRLAFDNEYLALELFRLLADRSRLLARGIQLLNYQLVLVQQRAIVVRVLFDWINNITRILRSISNWRKNEVNRAHLIVYYASCALLNFESQLIDGLLFVCDGFA